MTPRNISLQHLEDRVVFLSGGVPFRVRSRHTHQDAAWVSHPYVIGAGLVTMRVRDSDMREIALVWHQMTGIYTFGVYDRTDSIGPLQDAIAQTGQPILRLKDTASEEDIAGCLQLHDVSEPCNLFALTQ